MSDKRTYQSSDHAQTGGGLSKTNPNWESTYNAKPDSVGSGEISPNSSDRGREHTRGS